MPLLSVYRERLIFPAKITKTFRNAAFSGGEYSESAFECPPPAAEEKFFAVCGSLLLFAAHGETVRTVVVALGVHAGTVEGQARPVHARRRRRRTAPGVTDRAHIAQAAGIAGAATRSGVEVSSARSAKYKLRLLLRSLNRTLACALDTPARQCPNKFGIALT